VVAANSEFYSYRKGDVIFSEGSFATGSTSSGRRGAHHQAEADNETMTIAQFIAGESFGEMDLWRTGR